jgi:ferredoxin
MAALLDRGSMDPIKLSTLVTGTIIILFCLLFALSSYRESRRRAVWINLGIAVIVALLLMCSIHWWQLFNGFFFTATILIWTFAVLFFLPLNKPTSILINSITERVDERDTMFAREEYRPGTGIYKRYYANHTDYKEVDDRLRQLPALLEPGGRYFSPGKAQQIKAIFRAINELTLQVDGDVSANKIRKDPLTLTAEIKDLILRMGADEVGVARLNRMFVYSHVGRGPEPWGKPIELNHQYALVYTLEMAFNSVQEAPDIPITEEAALQYLRAAIISVNLARYIRNLGYPARAHISDSNYQIILPPVAHDAGLGELSRMGYLISPRYGARIRLGAVTTDLPLIQDRPIAFGVQDFCEICLKCAENCPSAAISHGGKMMIRGVKKWQISVEKCLWYWRIAGTDCGLCMKVCPYSHPPTFIHNAIRKGIKHSAFARKISLLGDDLFYGRRTGPYGHEPG